MNDLIVKDLSNALGFLNATLNPRNYGLNACKAYVLGCYTMVHHLHIFRFSEVDYIKIAKYISV